MTWRGWAAFSPYTGCSWLQGEADARMLVKVAQDDAGGRSADNAGAGVVVVSREGANKRTTNGRGGKAEGSSVWRTEADGKQTEARPRERECNAPWPPGSEHILKRCRSRELLRGVLDGDKRG